MDFFSYLQNSGKKNTNLNNSLKDETLNLNNSNDNIDINLDNNNYDVLNYNFKQGETVLITKYKNSNLNIYKGYFAFIKHYKKNADHAYVILPAMNYPKLIKIPIQHFTKMPK